MPAEKRENKYRGVTGEIRVAARGAATRAGGAERVSPQIHRLPAPSARPSPRTDVPLHRPVGDRGDLARKGVSSSSEIQPVSELVPIWLAALLASRCQAAGNGENRAVRWNCASGRALYTNAGAHTERIEPLGVTLKEGHTLAVCWVPGETTYSLEVFCQYDHCA
jgi:hypothetical protein